MNDFHRKNYSQEFKLEAVKWLETKGYSLNEAAMHLGVSKSVKSKICFY